MWRYPTFASFLILHTTYICLQSTNKLNWSHVLTVNRPAVCVGFLNRLYGSLTSAHTDLTPPLVEEELVQVCADAQGKEARLVRADTSTERKQTHQPFYHIIRDLH